MADKEVKKKNINSKTTKATKKAVKSTAKTKKVVKSDNAKVKAKAKPNGLNDKERAPTKRGRPFEFDHDLAIKLMRDEIKDYLATRNQTEKYFAIIPTSDTSSVVKGRAFTTVNDLALMCGVCTETLRNHCNARDDDGKIINEELHQTFKMFKDLCRSQLERGGLSGAYPSNVVAFLGSSNYDMVPKNSSQIEQTVEVKSLDKFYQELDEVYNVEMDRVQEQEQEMLQRKAELDSMEDDD